MLTTTTPTINLGDVQKNSTTPFTFNITNNSTDILTLNTKVTCGCTLPTLEKKVMEPLSMQYGKGTFKAPNGVGAIYNKSIYVTDQNGVTVTIKLTGNVI